MGGCGLIYLSGGWEQWLTLVNIRINPQASYNMVNFLIVGGTVGRQLLKENSAAAAWSLVG
jgi:hypothetical protein